MRDVVPVWIGNSYNYVISLETCLQLLNLEAVGQ